jgi:acetolactate synthase-1/2/3 large subunit
MMRTSAVRVADYIAQSLADHGIDTVFMVTGGGAMHLNDAIGREKRLTPVCCHHEQACAMAAESFFRLSGRLAAVTLPLDPGASTHSMACSGLGPIPWALSSFPAK